MERQASVSAVIPSWNRADLLTAILANLTSQTTPPAQVIVVDNGSTDDTAAVAEQHAAEVVRFPENRGFAVAVNEGIAKARCEWILILNNDVVLAPDWLETLLAAAEEADAAFAVGKLVAHADGNIIDGTWDLVSRAAYAWRCGYGRRDSPIWSTKREISLAPMTAALFHKRVFEAIGVLETRFESYYEDVDFGIRCALGGLRGIYEPKAVARHMSKATLGQASYRVMYLSARNQVLLLAKYYSGRTVSRFWWAILVGQGLAIVAAARHGHLEAALKGKWEGLRGWKAFRRKGLQQPGRDRQAVEQMFTDSEHTIRLLQQEIGLDPYWRLYFRLTGGL